MLVSRLSQKDKPFEQNHFSKTSLIMFEYENIKNVQTSSSKGISNEIKQCGQFVLTKASHFFGHLPFYKVNLGVFAIA